MKIFPAGFVVCLCLLLILSVSATDNSFKLDFDGDGATDIALYREGSRDVNVAPQPSYWYFLNTRTGQTGTVHWGQTLDVPAPADYDNDGKTDVGIYRWWDFESGDVNQWWLRQSSGGGHQVLIYEPGYNKFNRNYVGDGRAEIGQLYQVNISQDPNERCLVSVFFIGDLQGNTNTAKNVVLQDVNGDWTMESKLVFSRPLANNSEGAIPSRERKPCMWAAGALRGRPPSRTRTLRRARDRTSAADRPAAPPPTTTTS